MQLFSGLYIPALVACLIRLALGAYNPEQLGVDIQSATKQIQSADNYIDNQNAVDADLDTNKIVENSNTIQSALSGINDNLEGTTIPANADLAVDVPANEFISAYGDYLVDLKDLAKELVLPNDKTKIKDATNSLTDVFLDLLNNLINLFQGNKYAGALGQQVLEIKDDQVEFDTTYTDSGLKSRMRRSRVSRSA